MGNEYSHIGHIEFESSKDFINFLGTKLSSISSYIRSDFKINNNIIYRMESQFADIMDRSILVSKVLSFKPNKSGNSVINKEINVPIVDLYDDDSVDQFKSFIENFETDISKQFNSNSIIYSVDLYDSYNHFNDKYNIIKREDFEGVINLNYLKQNSNPVLLSEGAASTILDEYDNGCRHYIFNIILDRENILRLNIEFHSFASHSFCIYNRECILPIFENSITTLYYNKLSFNDILLAIECILQQEILYFCKVLKRGKIYFKDINKIKLNLTVESIGNV